MSKRDETLKQIARCLMHIAEEDLTTAEGQIVKVLVKAGILKVESDADTAGLMVVRPAW